MGEAGEGIQLRIDSGSELNALPLYFLDDTPFKRESLSPPICTRTGAALTSDLYAP